MSFYEKDQPSIYMSPSKDDFTQIDSVQIYIYISTWK